MSDNKNVDSNVPNSESQKSDIAPKLIHPNNANETVTNDNNEQSLPPQTPVAENSTEHSDEKATNTSNSQRPILKLFTNALPSALLGFILGLMASIITQYVFPGWFNKPVISVHTDDISSVPPKSTVINATNNARSRYNATIKSKDGTLDESEVYSFICGDAITPGYGDIVIRLSNSGNSQAILKRFEIELIDHHLLENIDYSLNEGSSIEDPTKYTVLYGIVDPNINITPTWHTVMKNDNTINSTEFPINTSLSPDEHGTYYLRTSFLQYGLYKLNIKVYYSYRGKKVYSNSSNSIYILYDNPDIINDKLGEHKK